MSNFETGNLVYAWTSGYRGGGEAMIRRISDLFLKAATEDQVILFGIQSKRPLNDPGAKEHAVKKLLSRLNFACWS